MRLYLISQKQNNDYDTFDSAVVVAPDEETARRTSPLTGKIVASLAEWRELREWCDGPEHVTVRYLGDAAGLEQGVVCASFNAG